MPVLKKGSVCTANSWHAKQGHSVHPTITVSTGTQTPSTAAADGASNNRPHRAKAWPLLQHFVDTCTYVHV